MTARSIKYLIIFLHVIFVGFFDTAFSYSLSDTFPILQKKSRNSEVLYRGLSPEQLNPTQAILGMLGDFVVIESKLFKTLRQRLMNKNMDLISQQDVKSEYLMFEEDLLQKKGFEKFDLNLVHEIEKILLKKYGEGWFMLNVVDYTKSSAKIFPVNTIFSSIYIDVATYYGPNILLIQDGLNGHNQSLDLNLWNLEKNKLLVGTVNRHPDLGEFADAFYILGERIIGYQFVRRDYLKKKQDHRVFIPLAHDMTYAAMKYVSEGSSYVMMFDAHGMSNLLYDKKNDLFCEPKNLFVLNDEIPQTSTLNCLDPSARKPRLIGIFSVCDSKENIQKGNSKCKPKQKLYEKYDFTEFPNELNFLESLAFSSDTMSKFVPKLWTKIQLENKPINTVTHAQKISGNNSRTKINEIFVKPDPNITTKIRKQFNDFVLEKKLELVQEQVAYTDANLKCKKIKKQLICESTFPITLSSTKTEKTAVFFRIPKNNYDFKTQSVELKVEGDEAKLDIQFLSLSKEHSFWLSNAKSNSDDRLLVSKPKSFLNIFSFSQNLITKLDLNFDDFILYRVPVDPMVIQIFVKNSTLKLIKIINVKVTSRLEG